VGGLAICGPRSKSCSQGGVNRPELGQVHIGKEQGQHRAQRTAVVDQQQRGLRVAKARAVSLAIT
jgi:hypothetical protein